jgi:hypothetical protein
MLVLLSTQPLCVKTSVQNTKVFGNADKPFLIPKAPTIIHIQLTLTMNTAPCSSRERDHFSSHPQFPLNYSELPGIYSILRSLNSRDCNVKEGSERVDPRPEPLSQGIHRGSLHRNACAPTYHLQMPPDHLHLQQDTQQSMCQPLRIDFSKHLLKDSYSKEDKSMFSRQRATSQMKSNANNNRMTDSNPLKQVSTQNQGNSGCQQF